MSAPSAIRIIRSAAAFLAHVLTAIIGVGILKTSSEPLVKLFTHSRVSIVLTEWTGSILFSALLGVSVQRRWKTRTANWIWIPALLWFLFGFIGFRPLGNPWLTFSGIACAYERGFPPCLQFTVFTVLLVRASTYSLAAFLSSRSSVQHPTEFHPVLSHLLSGLFLVGLPRMGEQSAREEAVTSPDKPE